MSKAARASFRLKQGDKHPYDAPASCWIGKTSQAPPAPEDWAHRAARGVLADLCDRRNIKWALRNEGLEGDDETRAEMVEQLAEIIRQARFQPLPATSG